MLIIGICGASGCGKSTLAEELVKAIGSGCTVINHDCYYKDHSHLPFEKRTRLNYDEPSIFDHDLFLEDIHKLMRGESITRKGYDYTNHCRADTDERIAPPKVLIIEGIHLFNDKRLLDLMFLRIYMKVDEDVCLLRRISRDLLERGRSLDSITDQYMASVKPMYEKHIRGYIEHADVIVAHGAKNARIVSILSGYIRHELHMAQAQQTADFADL